MIDEVSENISQYDYMTIFEAKSYRDSGQSGFLIRADLLHDLKTSEAAKPDKLGQILLVIARKKLRGWYPQRIK